MYTIYSTECYKEPHHLLSMPCPTLLPRLKSHKGWPLVPLALDLNGISTVNLCDVDGQ